MMIRHIALIILLAASFFHSAQVSIDMYPGSKSYVMREYSAGRSGIFSIEADEIKGVSPQQVSVRGRNGVSVFMTVLQEANKTKKMMKGMHELLNESISTSLSVKLKDGSVVSGLLQWKDGGSIGVMSDRFNIVPLDSVIQIAFSEQPGLYKDEQYTVRRLVFFGHSQSQSGLLLIGYPKSDLGWGISYDLYADSGSPRLVQYASIINSGDEEYGNAMVRLSMINPNFVGSSYAYRYPAYALKSYDYMEELSYSPAPEYSPEITGSIWRYTPSEAITIEPRSTKMLTVFDDSAKYTKSYVWDMNYDSNRAYYAYELNNTRKEILPAGTVRVFDSGGFMGEAAIGMLAEGESKELFVSDAPQFSVSKVQVSDDTSPHFAERLKHTVQVRLRVKNSGVSREEVEIRDYIPQYSDYRLEQSTLTPTEIDGGKVVWKQPINPGDTLEITYWYSYTSRY